VIAHLEQGAAAALFSSGMAPATVLFQALATGDHVLAFQGDVVESVQFDRGVAGRDAAAGIGRADGGGEVAPTVRL
jgi:Cys/Met metabolism PLP-dependent enzyme